MTSQIEHAIGRTVQTAVVKDGYEDETIVLTFTDGSALRITPQHDGTSFREKRYTGAFEIAVYRSIADLL